MMFLDRLNGSLQRVSNGKANIKRFPVLFNRLNMYMIGGVLLIPFIFFNFFDDEYITKRNNTFNYNQRIDSQYKEYKELYSRNNSRFPYSNYSQFFNDQITRYYDDFAFYIGSALVTFFPWLFILLTRPGAPVQVNRDKRLIYTWHRGKLYAARFDQLQPKCPATAGGWELSGGWGPLVLRLYPAGEVYDDNSKLNKGKKFKVGLYIPTLDWENKQLLRFIEEWAKHSFWGSSDEYWGEERVKRISDQIFESRSFQSKNDPKSQVIQEAYKRELEQYQNLFDKFMVLKPQSSQPTAFQLNLPQLDPTKGTAVLEVDIEIEYWLESSYIFDDNITLSRFKYELNYQDKKAMIDFGDFLPDGPGYIKEIIINAEYQQQGQSSMEIDDYVLYEYEAPTTIIRNKFDIQRGVPSKVVHMPQWRI